MGSNLCKDKLKSFKEPLVKKTESKKPIYTRTLPQDIMGTKLMQPLDTFQAIPPSAPRIMSMMEMCTIHPYESKAVPYLNVTRPSLINLLEREVEENPEAYGPMMHSPSLFSSGESSSPPMSNLTYELPPQTIYVDRSRRHIVHKSDILRLVGPSRPVFMEILISTDERRQVIIQDIWQPNIEVSKLELSDFSDNTENVGDLEDNWNIHWSFGEKKLSKKRSNPPF